MGELTPDCVVARCGRRGGGAESDSARAERCAAGRARTGPPLPSALSCPRLPLATAGRAHGKFSLPPRRLPPRLSAGAGRAARRGARGGAAGGHLFTHASSLSSAPSFFRRPERRRSSSADTALGSRRALDSRQRLSDSSAQSSVQCLPPPRERPTGGGVRSTSGRPPTGGGVATK